MDTKNIEVTTPREDDYNLAYIAGIYEGEGSCGAYLHGVGKYKLRRPQIAVRIEMYDIDIIRFISDQFEGNYTPRKRAAQVAFKGEKAINFLKTILPYLKGKRRREQAAQVFKLHEMKKQKLGRKDVHRQRLLADQAGKVNGYNYGGGRRTRRDYTHTSKPLGASDDIVQFSSEEVTAAAAVV